MDGYRLTTLIGTAQIIGNAIIDVAKDVIDLLTEGQDEEEAQPKDERQ